MDATSAKNSLDLYEAVFGPDAPTEQPDDVYAYYNLMQRAQAAFRELQGRWSYLAQWGVETKIPTSKAAISEWLDFAKAWTAKTEGGAFAGLDDMAAARQAAATLAEVEAAAQRLGYRDNEKLSAVTFPTKEEQDQALIDATSGVDKAFAKANLTIDQTERKAKELARQAAAKIADLPGSAWSAIPWYWKLGAAAVGVAIVVGTVRR